MLKRALLSALLPATLAASGCGLPRTAAYFHPSAADMGPMLDNYGEAIVPLHGLIVVQGDDLVYGTAAKRGRAAINGAPEPRDPFSISESMRSVLHGVEIVNRGYPADSIVDGFERWAGSPKGDLLILSYGFGDVKAKTPLPTYQQTLQRMVRQAHAAGAAVFLLTTPAVADRRLSDALEPYRLAMRKIGAQEGAEVFEAWQDLDRAHIPFPKGVVQSRAMNVAIAGDLVAYIKVVAAPLRPAAASPQSGQAGSGGSATMRTSADKAS